MLQPVFVIIFTQQELYHLPLNNVIAFITIQHHSLICNIGLLKENSWMKYYI